MGGKWEGIFDDGTRRIILDLLVGELNGLIIMDEDKEQTERVW